MKTESLALNPLYMTTIVCGSGHSSLGHNNIILSSVQIQSSLHHIVVAIVSQRPGHGLLSGLTPPGQECRKLFGYSVTSSHKSLIRVTVLRRLGSFLWFTYWIQADPWTSHPRR